MQSRLPWKQEGWVPRSQPWPSLPALPAGVPFLLGDEISPLLLAWLPLCLRTPQASQCLPLHTFFARFRVRIPYASCFPILTLNSPYEAKDEMFNSNVFSKCLLNSSAPLLTSQGLHPMRFMLLSSYLESAKWSQGWDKVNSYVFLGITCLTPGHHFSRF